MTPHQIELVKKLDQEVQNLSILMQHTEVGDSLTLKDIRHYLYLLNKEVKEVDFRNEIEEARGLINKDPHQAEVEIGSSVSAGFSRSDIEKCKNRLMEDWIVEQYHNIQKNKNQDTYPTEKK